MKGMMQVCWQLIPALQLILLKSLWMLNLNLSPVAARSAQHHCDPPES